MGKLKQIIKELVKITLKLQEIIIEEIKRGKKEEIEKFEQEEQQIFSKEVKEENIDLKKETEN